MQGFPGFMKACWTPKVFNIMTLCVCVLFRGFEFKSSTSWPIVLFVEELGHCFTYCWGPGGNAEDEDAQSAPKGPNAQMQGNYPKP